MYESESDECSSTPTKDEDPPVQSRFRTTPKALRSWTDRTERPDPALGTYSDANRQFPTKLPANHDKQMQSPRYATARDSQLYSATTNYSSRSPYLSSPSRRPLGLRDSPLISAWVNENSVYCSPTRSRSVEYRTGRVENGFKRGYSPYRGVNP